MPFDSRSNLTKPGTSYDPPHPLLLIFIVVEWLLFAAGLVPDTAMRDKLIDSVSRFLSSGPTNDCGWCDLYDVNKGNCTVFGNRAVVGGVYSLLVRDLPAKALIAKTGSATLLLISWSVTTVSALSLFGSDADMYLGLFGVGFGAFIIIEYTLFSVV